MAKEKKTFIFYSDWINIVREMPDADAGVLLKHILSYVNAEKPTTDNLLVKMAFGHMKPMLKKDLEKWEKQLQKFSDMGKASAEKRKKQHTLTQVEPTLTQVERRNTVNDNVNVNTNTTIEAEVDFLVVDGWIKEISKSQMYLEGLYRLHKLRKGTISELTTNFREHLKVYPKKHLNFSDFKKHFASWLQIKNSKGQLAKYQKETKGQL